MIKIKGCKGRFTSAEQWMERLKQMVKRGDFDKYGRWGVELLTEYTPIDSGKTRDGWTYEIEHGLGKTRIVWDNTNQTAEGTRIAILIQYGHFTNGAGWVEGTDFINPAVRELADRINNDMRRKGI